MKRWDFLQLLAWPASSIKEFNGNVLDNVYRRPNVYKMKWIVPFTLCAVRGDPQWRGDPARLGVTALTSGSRCPARVSVWHRRIWSSLKPEREVPKPSGFGGAEVPSSMTTAFHPVLCGLMYNMLCWGWVQLSVFIPRSPRRFFCQKTKQQKFHSMQNTDLCIASEIFR